MYHCSPTSVSCCCCPSALLQSFSILACRPAEEILAFSKDAVNHVVEAYCPIVKKHMNDSFTEEQKQWQQIRRGRCVMCV